MRRSPLRTFSVVGLLSTLGLASSARAQLLPPFTNSLVLDSGYVTNAAQATDIAFSNDGRAVVTRKTGEIVVRHADATTTTVAYPFPGTLDSSSEKGLLGVVAEPNALNNSFYFYVSNGPTNDKHRVYRAVLTETNAFSVDPVPVVGASRGVGPGLEGPANHDGGGLFIYAGKLYVSVGDTGFNSSPPSNKYASCLNKGNGKILRVNLDGSVPSDNPLIGLSSVTACNSETGPWTTAAPDTRIFSWGLRNPWRFWIDPATSLLWIGDVGEVTQEEISVGGGNQHYGYPFVEGNQIWGDVEGKNCNALSPSRPCSSPAYAYGRSDGQSVTGGLIPSGCGWTNVFSGPTYMFADSSAGWIRSLPVNASRTGFTSTSPVEVASVAGLAPVSFRMGPDQSLYVVMNTGSVYRFTPSNRSGAGCAPTVPANPYPWLQAIAFAAIAWIGLGARRST